MTKIAKQFIRFFFIFLACSLLIYFKKVDFVFVLVDFIEFILKAIIVCAKLAAIIVFFDWYTRVRNINNQKQE